MGGKKERMDSEERGLKDRSVKGESRTLLTGRPLGKGCSIDGNAAD